MAEKDQAKDREREERLAAALRENLRRRKAQSRDIRSTPAKAGVQAGEADKR